jgi:glycoprotein endo-alpha-1,2-mannosidase
MAGLLAGLVAACGSPVPSPSPDVPTASLSQAPSASAPAVSSASDSPPYTPSPSPLPPSLDVTAFFYTWYGSVTYDGAWRHWTQLGHKPPGDIASAFYPQIGPYASRDPQVMARQMQELRAARIGVISVSWWGQGEWDDQTLPALFAAASDAGIKIAFQLEPYSGQTAASVAADIRYLLQRYGQSPALYRVARPTSSDPSTAARPVFYLFASSRLPVADLAAAIAGLRHTENDPILLVHSPKAVSATRVGADGVYTYNAMANPADLAGLVADCRAANLICSPSVAPGFDNTQAVATGHVVVDRQSGARYDAMWQAVEDAGAEWVSITTFNEWHEGTQIEPAIDYAADSRTYVGYTGAYGASPEEAPDAYLARTAYWIGKLPGG